VGVEVEDTLLSVGALYDRMWGQHVHSVVRERVDRAHGASDFLSVEDFVFVL
jgi:hypothetical protein